jgi:hypothetical protein
LRRHPSEAARLAVSLLELPDVEVLARCGGITKFGIVFQFLYPAAHRLLRLTDLIRDGLLRPTVEMQIPR